MGSREGRGPRTLTLIIVACVILSLIPAPAAGSHGTDIVNAAITGWTSTASGVACPAGLSCDGTDVTGDRVDGHCGSQDVGRGTHNYCTGYVQFTRSSGVTTFTIESIRVHAMTCQNGGGTGSCGGATLDMTSMVVQELIAGTCSGTAPELGYASQSADDTFDTGEISITPVVIANNEGLCIFVEVVAMNTSQWFTVSSFEAYAEPLGPTEVAITEYIYNLRAYHPPFIRRYTWEWVAEPEWSGTWSLTDSDDTLIAGEFRPGLNHFEQVDINCPVVCGDDTYLLTINDATNDRVAYYEIDGDADGQLIDDVLPPRLVGITSFCYQATSAQCDAVITTVGVVKVTYTFTGTPGYEYSISAGQMLTAASVPNHGGGVSGTHEPGSYTLYIPAANMDTDGPPYAVLLITAGTGGRTFSVSDELDFSGGGTVTTLEPPDPTEVPTSCPQFDIICGLRSLFNVGASAIMAAFQNAYGALISRQPFAFLFGSAAAAAGQIARAQASVEASDDCAGVHFTMPTLPPVSYHAFGADKTANPKYYAFNGNVPTATPFAFSALRCEDLEPWGGTDWWQGLRTIMGPALVMGYAFQLFRRYEVKPQLGG